jgi:hypothetical protein
VVLGGTAESLPADPGWVKSALVAFVSEWYNGYLTQGLVRKWIEPHYPPPDLSILVDPSACDKETVGSICSLRSKFMF